MSGYDSRPLREDELHQRLAKSGHALRANLSWATVPICNADDVMALEPMPVILPSEMVSSRDEVFCTIGGYNMLTFVPKPYDWMSGPGVCSHPGRLWQHHGVGETCWVANVLATHGS